MSTANGALSTADAGALAAALRSALRGEVIDRTHFEYDRARQVWNGLIERYPEVIARCSDTADVVEALRIRAAYDPTGLLDAAARRP